MLKEIKILGLAQKYRCDIHLYCGSPEWGQRKMNGEGVVQKENN
jgi:hypothetical protein